MFFKNKNSVPPASFFLGGFLSFVFLFFGNPLQAEEFGVKPYVSPVSEYLNSKQGFLTTPNNNIPSAITPSTQSLNGNQGPLATPQDNNPINIKTEEFAGPPRPGFSSAGGTETLSTDNALLPSYDPASNIDPLNISNQTVGKEVIEAESAAETARIEAKAEADAEAAAEAAEEEARKQKIKNLDKETIDLKTQSEKIEKEKQDLNKAKKDFGKAVEKEDKILDYFPSDPGQLTGIITKKDEDFETISKNKDLLYYIPRLINLVLWVVAPFVAFMFVFSGLQFIYAGDDDEQLTKSKEFFLYAIMGLIFIAISYSLMKGVYLVLQ